MNGLLSTLGVGVVFAYLALPLLAWAAARDAGSDAQSRQGPLLLALVAGVGLLLLPLVLPQAAPAPAVAAGAPAAVLEAVFTPLPVSQGLSLSPLGALGLLWTGLVAASAARLLLSLLRLGSVLRSSQAASPGLQELADRLADELLVSRTGVRVTDGVNVPMLVPGLRPTILLPASLVSTLSEARLELTLRHELTHLARRDHRVAGLAAVLRLPFVLHPAAARLEFELALAREEAVDARVGAADRGEYARLLLEVAEQRAQVTRWAPVATMDDTALARRIDSLVQLRARPLARLAPVLLVGLLCTVGAAVAGPGLVQAAEAEALAAPEASGWEGVDGEPGQLVLQRGTRKVLTVEGLSRLSVGDPSVADVGSMGGGRVAVTGVSLGRTTLLLWSADNRRQSVLVVVTD